MSDYMTTTSGNFPVKDITHRPKRMQGDMLKLKESIPSETAQGSSNSEETLAVVTLERAISYYKRKSDDAVNGNLYSATAKWLEELLVTRTISKTEAARKAVSEGENKVDESTEAQQ